MNKNIKIAKQLVRIAKSLIAEQNVADHEGKYENFTGTIKWNGIKGTVSNATFELVSRFTTTIIWESGTWKDGIFYHGIWDSGTWEKGIWKDGVWRDGTWKDGNWLGGKDAKGKFHGKGDSPDKWDNPGDYPDDGSLYLTRSNSSGNSSKKKEQEQKREHKPDWLFVMPKTR